MPAAVNTSSWEKKWDCSLSNAISSTAVIIKLIGVDRFKVNDPAIRLNISYFVRRLSHMLFDQSLHNFHHQPIYPRFFSLADIFTPGNKKELKGKEEIIWRDGNMKS